MTPQELSDRAEIHEVLVRYCHAVDQRQWSVFEVLFAEDAILDYTAFGGPRCGAKEMSIYLNSTLDSVQGSQHTISTSLVEIAGDMATARSAAQVMMIATDGACGTCVTFIGLWYRDALIRSPTGWRIRERVQEHSWVHNAPPSLEFGTS